MEKLIELAREVPTRRQPHVLSSFHLGMALHLGVVRGLVNPYPGLGLAAERLRVAVEEGAVAEAAMALARILVVAGQEGAALAALARARQFDSSNVLAWFLAAELQVRCGDMGAAVELFKGGVAAAPMVSDTARSRALAELERDPHSSRALCALGRVMREAGLVFVAGLVPKVDGGLAWTAYDYYQRAVKADPMNEEAANELADLLQYLGLDDFASKFRRLSVALHPADAGARQRLKTALTRSYLLEEAAQQERVIACLTGREPSGGQGEKADAYRAAIAALRSAGQEGQAQLLAARAAALDGDDPEVLKERAIAALHLHDYAATRDYLSRVVKYADASRDELDALLRLLGELEDAQTGKV